jgi:hypothetical protein
MTGFSSGSFRRGLPSVGPKARRMLNGPQPLAGFLAALRTTRKDGAWGGDGAMPPAKAGLHAIEDSAFPGLAPWASLCRSGGAKMTCQNRRCMRALPRVTGFLAPQRRNNLPRRIALGKARSAKWQFFQAPQGRHIPPPMASPMPGVEPPFRAAYSSTDGKPDAGLKPGATP